ncbi:MAG: prolyl-tRNA synthetase [Pseudomonadota bacterium]
MRFSNVLIPTTKETPNDATLPSHIFLMRGGFIQSVGGSGLYNFLPLGKRVLDKVHAIVKEELDQAGCQEVSLSFVTPASLWEESGRMEKYGKELLRFKDRKENDFVLGPTHEEMMVNLVRQTVKSYKQLPLNLYQINLKFRDEIRPRFGLMRGREFLMKDGYSFHKDTEDMQREFALMEETYKKIFTRLGLDFRVVDADSGAIGGTGSKEFHVIADSGEDTIVVCDSCDYGANIEAATRVKKAYNHKKELGSGAKATPDAFTIDEVSRFFDIETTQTIKSVAKKAIFKEEEKIVLFFIRGNEELEETKACNSIDALELQDVDENELRNAGLFPGSIGIVDLPEDIIYRIDHELKDESEMVCGANKEHTHLVGVDVCCREDEVYADLVAVKEGDICSGCGGTLSYTKGIEVGHIFQLGTRYSEPLQANFLDENGKSQPMVMGTYGIGVSRLLAAIIEQNHDENGCIWTKASAPFHLQIIISNIKDDEQVALGEKLYEAMQAKGVEVLLDDRKDRFGAKIKDYELMGVPYAVVIGKNLEEGKVEFITRATMDKEEIAADKIVALLSEKF